jgi:hypothetical protein
MPVSTTARRQRPPQLDPDPVVTACGAAQRRRELKYQIEREALVLDPTGDGRCWKRTCQCGAQSLGSRSTFEIPEARVCHACGSSETRVDETRYPRHTEETLRWHIDREFGDYLRRQRSRPHRTRSIVRERGCRSRSHRVAASSSKSSSGDSGDSDGEPPEPEPPSRPHAATIGGVR